MGRPAKNVSVMAKHLTKEEMAKRKELEDKLKGGTDKIKPPSYLTKEQKKIFNFIVKELENAEILSNLDVFILEKCAVSLDRIRESEIILNKDLLNKEALKVKESYSKEFFRCCNELSLSPQSRAKLGNINIKSTQEAKDPVLKLVGSK